MSRFTLFASVAQESEDRFLYTGGAAGIAIDNLKTSNKSFWVFLSKNKK